MTEYAEYVVHARAADDGWELHVHALGVVLVRERADAERVVREFLEGHGREDALTARLVIDWPDDL
ncbi:MAG TPA: hypothetical protein VKB14_11435 [Actinomycetales bacterium]|nr:hypothetical protein [Actinomycetales bacterium]